MSFYNSDKTTVLMLRAVTSKFESIREENLAIASHYLSKSVGIGDHPDIVSGAVEAIRKASEATECLEFMNSSKFQGILEHTTAVGKFFDKK